MKFVSQTHRPIAVGARTIRPMSYFLMSLVAFQLLSCYTFRGFSISDDTRTYELNPFIVSRKANLAPPDLGETFSETLKEKVRQETPLSFTQTEGDVLFEGEITDYTVTSVAPRGSDDPLQLDVGSDLSRLTIRIHVDYTNRKDEALSFSKQFDFFADFDSETNLADVQEDLQEQIFERILEDVFNAAFSNW